MTEQDQILQFLRLSGPVLPTKVAKNMKMEILLASAHLSDLSSQGKLKISYLKVGGSPLYYLSGQEAQLYSFAAGNLNQKDLQVLERLKAEKVMQESKIDLLSKVALRELKDFAVPLHVTIEGKKELFWKWALLSEEETNQKINLLLAPSPANQPLPSRELPPTAPSAFSPSLLIKEQLTLEPKKEVEVVVSSPPEKKVPEKIKETKERKKRTPIEDELFPKVEKFFHKMKIAIEQKETLRKNAEMNFTIQVPSAVGGMRYFCKAKNKARCDEKDLSAAYMEAQMKKLPLLFLHTEEINKKAQEMLESNAFENIVVKKLE